MQNIRTRAQRNRRNPNPPRPSYELQGERIVAMGIGETSGSSSVQILIPGQPIAQPRPRIGRTRTSRPYVYNPGSRAKLFFANRIKLELQEAGLLSPARNPAPIYHTPVAIEVTFGVANMSKDLDNMLKFILDVLEAAGVYTNDRLVQKIVAQKTHSLTGFTTLNVSGWNPAAGVLV